LTQRRTMSILNGVNNKLVQKFDEVVSAWQQWQCNLGYFILKTSVPTLTIISIGVQNQQPNPNIDLVTTNSKMEQI
jgi:hypothetical protein